MPTLVFVPSEAHQVSFNLSKPPETQKALFASLKLSGICSYEEFPHYECGLLTYLLENNIASVADPVIGVSRGSCFGCMAWFEAVNAALKSKVSATGLMKMMSNEEFLKRLCARFSDIQHQEFSIVGAHNKIHPSYTFPRFPSHPERFKDLVKCIDANLIACLVTEIERIRMCNRTRSDSDSDLPHSSERANEQIIADIQSRRLAEEAS